MLCPLGPRPRPLGLSPSSRRKAGKEAAEGSRTADIIGRSQPREGEEGRGVGIEKGKHGSRRKGCGPPAHFWLSERNAAADH